MSNDLQRERDRLRALLDRVHAELHDVLNATPFDSPDGTCSGFDYELRKRVMGDLADGDHWRWRLKLTQYIDDAKRACGEFNDMIGKPLPETCAEMLAEIVRLRRKCGET